MALDTRNRRASVLAIALVASAVFPNPDGSLGTEPDRRHMAYSYAGIPGSSAAVQTPVRVVNYSEARYGVEVLRGN